VLTLTAQPLRANFSLHGEPCIELLDSPSIAVSGGVVKEIASSSKTKPKIKLKGKRAFNAQAFLDSAGVSRKVVEYRRAF
jgi:hypothetical protein